MSYEPPKEGHPVPPSRRGYITITDKLTVFGE